MCLSVFPQPVASSVFHIWCWTSRVPCCPSNSSLSLCITHFSPDALIKTTLQATSYSPLQTIQQRLNLLCNMHVEVWKLSILCAGLNAWEQNEWGKHLICVACTLHWMQACTSCRVNTLWCTLTHVRCRHYQCNAGLFTADRAHHPGSERKHVSWESHGGRPGRMWWKNKHIYLTVHINKHCCVNAPELVLLHLQLLDRFSLKANYSIEKIHEIIQNICIMQRGGSH